MTIAKDSRSYPTLAVLQEPLYELAGVDVEYHVYMMSWQCSMAVKQGRLFDESCSIIKRSEHYQELKRKFYFGKLKQHPHMLLGHLYDNHERGAREHGYWGIDA